jgi:23S rRNA (guanosine2251-2'-O)-methyltransferase
MPFGDFEDLVVQRGRAVRLLLLDGVEDPRNLGACLRTADAAGIDAVVVPKDHSAPLTAVAIKAATGAAETVPVVRAPNLARCLTWLKEAGVWVVGADSEAERSLYAAKLAPPVAIVLGGEGRGLRRLTRETCDELVKIPMVGAVQSLNVSVATGIVLFELLRQAPPK